MLAIEVEFLSGSYVATAHDGREAGEWPPHPVRLLYGLVAAASRERTPDEEAVIEWLCAQPAPAITAAVAYPRDVRTAYVPVNDQSAPGRGASAGTIPRNRQPRTFPTMHPADPLVTFCWPEDPPGPLRDALARLAARVPYIGHSSSLVRVAVTDRTPEPTLRPRTDGRTLLRVPAPGLLPELDAALHRYEATGARGPLPCDYAAYGETVAVPGPLAASLFGEMLVLQRTRGPRLPIASAERVATSLREAVLALARDPVPEEITGHRADGGPSQSPHVAFVALPDVGHVHASGQLVGVAAVLPRDVDPAVRAALHLAISALLASGGILRISRSIGWTVAAGGDAALPQRVGALPSRWRGPAGRWASATPLELDRFVPDRLGEEAEATVVASVQRLGLPRPERVVLTPVSPLAGGGHWRDMRRKARAGRRPLVHALIDFPDPVEGPVLVGSGRYRGLGLCAPFSKTFE